MTIVSTGFVGIGTTAPSATLHVIGNSQFSGGLTTASSIFASLNGNFNGRLTASTMGLGIGYNAPSTTLQVSGTLRIANGGEACDANRLGAIKYASGAFSVCQSVSNGWEALATSGANANNDRIISGTTQAIAYSNTSLSLVTAGTERVVIGTNGNVGIGQQPASDVALGLSGTAVITSNTEIRGIVSTSAVQLAENPGQSCNPGTYGTIKIVGGRLFVCKQTP